MLFKKKESKPICVHDWHLIDTWVNEFYNGIDTDFDEIYKVACVKCNEVREMDSYNYRHFGRTFNIKNQK